MTGRRRPPRRDVIVAAGSPAVPTLPAAQGGQVPALFRAVTDCLTAGVGAAPSALPMAPARPREPVYRSPRGRTHPFLPMPAQYAPPIPPPRPPPPAPEPAPPPRTCPSAPVAPPPQADPAPPVGVQAPPPSSAPGPGPAQPPPRPSPPPPAPPSLGPTPAAPFAYWYPPRLDVAASAPPGPRGLPFPIPAPHGPQRQHLLVPGSRPHAAWFAFVSSPHVVSLPVAACCSPLPITHLLCLALSPSPAILRSLRSRSISRCLDFPADTGVKTRCLGPLVTLSPPWGEPRPGDGAYQSRGTHLAEVGRCVTELSLVLDLLHDALQPREVVA
ncbi:unnamed protein product [Closterium sp. NIES-64]|nr:unnamed protein product [Closterium sp. NIES-64]CAI5964838.1 unnamed protein product [Closterium sp. NIES-64]